MGKVIGGVPLNHVRLTTNGGGGGTVEIDGHDIASGVRRFNLSAGVGDLPRLDVEIVPHSVAEYEGEAFVRLNPEFEDFLATLGWTPPRTP